MAKGLNRPKLSMAQRQQQRLDRMDARDQYHKRKEAELLRRFGFVALSMLVCVAGYAFAFGATWFYYPLPWSSMEGLLFRIVFAAGFLFSLLGAISWTLEHWQAWQRMKKTIRAVDKLRWR